MALKSQAAPIRIDKPYNTFTFEPQVGEHLVLHESDYVGLHRCWFDRRGRVTIHSSNANFGTLRCTACKRWISIPRTLTLAGLRQKLAT